MDQQLRDYFAKIGQRGGKKSRRRLSSDVARQMVRVREARRAFKLFYTQCFWSYAPNYHVSADDILWVAEQLMKHGNREAWVKGSKLCL